MRGWPEISIRGCQPIVIALALSLPIANPCDAFAADHAVGTNGVSAKEALAAEYLALTDRAELFRKTYAQQLKIAWDVCDASACQRDFYKTVDTAMIVVSSQYELHARQFMTDNLSVDELQAAIRFVKSPEGQAIIRVQSKLTNETATFAHNLSLLARSEVSRRFCPSHADRCTADGQLAMPMNASASKSD